MKQNVKLATQLFLVLLFCSSAVQAENLQKIPYYGEDFYNEVPNGVRDTKLIEILRAVLQLKHQVTKGGFDRITSNCDSGSTCYSHFSIGYDRAKTFLMGEFYLVRDPKGYAVRDVYCETEYTSPGPGQIPSSQVVNIEHTWPQSRFTGRFGKDIQKADLHHLFPTDSQLNSIRGNYPFGEVARDEKVLKCQCSRFGESSDGHNLVFEPPTAHRGNVARALFYFSVRYQIEIDPSQEKFLRQWHSDDPVDEEELERNEKIFKLQGNRNPFIDFPELVSKINNF